LTQDTQICYNSTMPRWIPIRDAAHLAGVSRDFIERRVARGEIASKSGKRKGSAGKAPTLVDLDDVLDAKESKEYTKAREAFGYFEEGRSYKWIAQHMGGIKVASARRLVERGRKG